jgi:hypothetical protein
MVRRDVALTMDAAGKYIDEVRWQFAKTMRQWPHESTVGSWRPDLDDAFEEVVVLIRADGVVKPWRTDAFTPRFRHTYLAIDGWDYWTMGENPAQTIVARVEPEGSWIES